MGRSTSRTGWTRRICRVYIFLCSILDIACMLWYPTLLSYGKHLTSFGPLAMVSVVSNCFLYIQPQQNISSANSPVLWTFCDDSSVRDPCCVGTMQWQKKESWTGKIAWTRRTGSSLVTVMVSLPTTLGRYVFTIASGKLSTWKQNVNLQSGLTLKDWREILIDRL